MLIYGFNFTKHLIGFKNFKSNRRRACEIITCQCEELAYTRAIITIPFDTINNIGISLYICRYPIFNLCTALKQLFRLMEVFSFAMNLQL